MGFPMLGSGFLLGSLQGPLTHTAGAGVSSSHLTCISVSEAEAFRTGLDIA